MFTMKLILSVSLEGFRVFVSDTALIPKAETVEWIKYPIIFNIISDWPWKCVAYYTKHEKTLEML